MKPLERLALTGMIALAGTIGAFELAARSGLRFNVDPSMPMGAYWFQPGPVPRGAIAQSCLPPTLARYAVRRRYLVTGGACPSGALPIVKFLAATSADHIVISNTGVTINGLHWPMSAIRHVDSFGRLVDVRLPSGRYACPKASVFLLGEHPRSWDSRYWGCVPRTTIAGRWIPIPLTGWTSSIFSTIAYTKEHFS